MATKTPKAIAKELERLRANTARGDQSLVALSIGIKNHAYITADETAKTICELAGVPASYWRDLRKGAQLVDFMEK